MKSISTLLRKVQVVTRAGAEEVQIDDLCYDSRQVTTGSCFFAVRGTAMDGHRFIPMAEERGAVAVVCQVSVVPFVEGDAAMMVNAFLFSLIPSVVIVLISSFKRTGSTMMILVGIALMYVFNAITTFIKFNADDEDVVVMQ